MLFQFSSAVASICLICEYSPVVFSQKVVGNHHSKLLNKASLSSNYESFDFLKLYLKITKSYLVRQEQIVQNHINEIRNAFHFCSFPDNFCSAGSSLPECTYENIQEITATSESPEYPFNIEFTHDFFSVLVITAVTILTFLLGYIIVDKSRKEAPLIAKINTLEKELLVALKENQLLSEKTVDSVDGVSSEAVEALTYELAVMKNTKLALEEQIHNLEKELENSTEVGLELNRMLAEVLSSQNGSDTLIANVEHLQRQLVEQQDTINSVNESLNEKSTENHELRLELEISNKKVTELQAELDKMVLNLLKIEEEKEIQQNTLEAEVSALKQQFAKLVDQSNAESAHLRNEIQQLQHLLSEAQRNVDLKTNELNLLKDTVADFNPETIQSLLEVNGIKAELMQLKRENQLLSEHLQQEREEKNSVEKRAEATIEEIQKLRERYEKSDKEKLEAQTKLQVLSVYFKEKEAQLQK